MNSRRWIYTKFGWCFTVDNIKILVWMSKILLKSWWLFLRLISTLFECSRIWYNAWRTSLIVRSFPTKDPIWAFSLIKIDALVDIEWYIKGSRGSSNNVNWGKLEKFTMIISVGGEVIVYSVSWRGVMGYRLKLWISHCYFLKKLFWKQQTKI